MQEAVVFHLLNQTPTPTPTSISALTRAEA